MGEKRFLFESEINNEVYFYYKDLNYMKSMLSNPITSDKEKIKVLESLIKNFLPAYETYDKPNYNVFDVISPYYELFLNYPLSLTMNIFKEMVNLGVCKKTNLSFRRALKDFEKSSSTSLVDNIIKELKLLNYPLKKIFFSFIDYLELDKDEQRKIFKEINFFNLNKKVLVESKVLNGLQLYLLSEDYNLSDLIEISEFLIASGFKTLDEVRKEFSEYIKVKITENDFFIMTKRYENYKNSVKKNWTYYFDGMETFWFVYFKFIANLKHESLKITKNDDYLIRDFYLFRDLSGDLCLRIPSEYKIKLNSVNSNIIYSMYVYISTYKERVFPSIDFNPFIIENLIKLVADNDNILLSPIIEISYTKKNNLFNLINESNWGSKLPEKLRPSKGVFSVFKKKVYKKDENGDIYFLPIVDGIKKEEAIDCNTDNTPSVCLDIDVILNNWGVDISLLNDNEMTTLKELAYMLSMVRGFLKKFNSIDEDVFFLQEHVDIYVKDLVVNHQKDILMRKEISAFSSINIDNSASFIENFSLLKKKIQFSIDKVIKDYKNVQDFENKKMKIFLEDRFPESV